MKCWRNRNIKKNNQMMEKQKYKKKKIVSQIEIFLKKMKMLEKQKY